MTAHQDELTDIRPSRQRIALVLAIAAAVPALVVRAAAPDLPHALEAALFGLAIVGAAFILSWAAEVAQLDISAGLAIAVLALIAVLPEYAVDFVFAWQGGNSFEATGPACLPPPGGGEESPCGLALANMTGANRLLIGIGWSMVVFIAWYRIRKRDGTASVKRWQGIQLDRSHSVELAYLAAATIYSLTLPLKHSITPFDALVLVTIFVMYTIRVSKAPSEEPHLVGPARYLGTFSTRARRTSIVLMFVFAGAVILLCAGRFAHALGRDGSRRRHQRVLPGAVARPAGVGGAGAADRGPLRVAAEHERGARDAGLVEGQPVDAAGRHAADRLLDRRRRPARVADRARSSARSCSSRRRSRSSRSRSCRTCRSRSARRGSCSACSGRSSSWVRSCPSPGTRPS